MEKISWTNRVKNELFYRVKEEWNILKIMKVQKVRT